MCFETKLVQAQVKVATLYIHVSFKLMFCSHKSDMFVDSGTDAY